MYKDMKNMKRKKIMNNLKFQFMFYFVLFTILIISLITIFQIFTFESLYRYNKEKSVNEYGTELKDVINTENNSINSIVNSDLYNRMRESGVGMNLVYIDSSNNLKFYYPFNQEQAYNQYSNSINSIINLRNQSVNYVTNSYRTEGEYLLIYCDKINYQNTNCYLVLITPLQSLIETVSTLRTQLLIVSLIVLVLSILVSYLISNRLSKPINDMCETAEKWGNGDKSVVFSGDNTEELEELASTLNNAKEEIQKSEQLEKDLLANVTHDLKTPLTMIKAYAEMIQDISGEVKEKRDKHCQVIIDEVDRLTFLVNDILNLSKLQSGVSEIDKSVFNLSELLSTVIYRFETAYENQEFIIKQSIESDVYVEADEKKIETVIYNLIGNSLNYTGEDKTIKIYLNKVDKIARLEILDSGKGIEKDKIDTIWTKYLRLSETHHRQVSGTGLGLSIVKAILDRHQIEYGVISKVDVGSNFYVIFNVVDVEDKQDER